MSEYFDIMKSVVTKKNFPDETVKKYFNGWQTISWLGNHHKAVYEANFINSCRGNKYIDNLAEYKALKYIIHIPKNTYLQNDKKDKHNKIISKILMKHFKVGKTTAKEYLKVLPNNELLKILELYARKNEKYIDSKSLLEATEMREAIKNIKKTIRN